MARRVGLKCYSTNVFGASATNMGPAVVHIAICPACAPHTGHAPGECDDCACVEESRPGRSEFIIQGCNATYFRQRVRFGPQFGASRAEAQHFKTGRAVAAEMAAWPAAASVGCKVEAVVEDSTDGGAPAPKPFLKWAGGKRQLLPELRKYVPEKFEHYYEPFVGGGALFFDLRAHGGKFRATLGDANERLVRTYLGVRNDVESVINQLKGMRYEKAFYLAQRGRRVDLADDSEVAAWFIYLNRTGFNGLYRVNSKGQFNVPFGRYDNPTICDAENLSACAGALGGTKIVSGDFEKIVRSAETGDFCYCDPPYVPAGGAADFTSYTSGGFTIADQERLVRTARGLKGRGVHVVLSNADVPVVRRLYRGFTITRVQARRNINSKATARGTVGEVIIT
jgi:DNA adenine methylase